MHSLMLVDVPVGTKVFSAGVDMQLSTSTMYLMVAGAVMLRGRLICEFELGGYIVVHGQVDVNR